MPLKHQTPNLLLIISYYSFLFSLHFGDNIVVFKLLKSAKKLNFAPYEQKK